MHIQYKKYSPIFRLIATILAVCFTLTTLSQDIAYACQSKKYTLNRPLASGNLDGTSFESVPRGVRTNFEKFVDLYAKKSSEGELTPEEKELKKFFLNPRAISDMQLAVKMVIKYLARQYKAPTFTGLSSKEIANDAGKISLRESPIQLKTILQNLWSIWNNNMKLNDRFIGHMCTTPLALPIFVNSFIDYLNVNQARSDSSLFSYIEEQTIRWLTEIAGYKEEILEDGTKVVPGGTITNGGTLANFVAFLIMRNLGVSRISGGNIDVAEVGMVGAIRSYLKDNPSSAKDFVILTSEEAHYSHEKLGGYEGFGSENVIGVKTDENFKMDIEDLKLKIKNARKDGKIILGIIATAGTTETGSIDPLEDIAEVARQNKIWFHVDAAYGGPCTLSKRHTELKKVMEGMKLADSVTIDPHKLMYIPYNMGAIVFKDRRNLAYTREYDLDRFNGFNRKDLFNLGSDAILEQKRFDSLKLWVGLKYMGTDILSELIDYTIDLTFYLYGLIEKIDDFEIMSKPEMNIFTFRYIPPEIKKKLGKAVENDDKEAINELNGILNKINKEIKLKFQNSGDGYFSLAEMPHSKYSRYATDKEGSSANVAVLRIVLMNPFVTEQGLVEELGKFSKICEEVADRYKDELKLKKISQIKTPTKAESATPEKAFRFKNYFVHPGNIKEMQEIGRRFIDLLQDSEDLAAAKYDRLHSFEKIFGNFELPKTPSSVESVFTALEELKNYTLYSGDGRIGNLGSDVPYVAMLASIIYSSLNPNHISWEVSPVSTHIENRTTQWLASFLGYRDYKRLVKVFNTNTRQYEEKEEDVYPGGVITNGTTASDLTALLVARNYMLDRLLGEHGIDVTKSGLINASAVEEKLSKMVILVSESCYESIKKLANVIGIGSDNIIAVRDNEGCIDYADLEEKMDDLTAKEGKIIMIVVASIAKTKNMNNLKNLMKLFREIRVDDINTRPRKKPQKNIWLHIKPSNNAYAVMTEKFKTLRKTIILANSVTIDPREWFSMPLGLGAVLFKHKGLLEHYLKQSASYVIHKGDREKEILNIGGYSIEGSKGFQALLLWMTLRLMGKENIRKLSSLRYRKAQYLLKKIKGSGQLEFIHNDDLSFNFRYVPYALRRRLNILKAQLAKKFEEVALESKKRSDNATKLSKMNFFKERRQLQRAFELSQATMQSIQEEISGVNSEIDRLNELLVESIRKDNKPWVSIEVINCPTYGRIVTLRTVLKDPFVKTTDIDSIIEYIVKTGDENSRTNRWKKKEQEGMLFPTPFDEIDADSVRLMKAVMKESKRKNISNDGIRPKTAFIFPGTGSEFKDMGKDLYDDKNHPKVKQIYDYAAQVLGIKVENLFLSEPEDLATFEIVSPAILTMSIALYEEFKDQIPSPSVLTGHSVGELAALVVAEAISFEDALVFIKERSRFLTESVIGKDVSAVVISGLDRENLEKLLEKGRVELSCINAPNQMVVSGESDSINELKQKVRKLGGGIRVIRSGIAPHTSLSKLAATKIEAFLESNQITVKNPKIPVFSTSLGRYIYTSKEVKEALIYHITHPVLWEQSIKTIIDEGIELFVELGPGRVLTNLFKKIDPSQICISVSQLLRKEDASSIEEKVIGPGRKDRKDRDVFESNREDVPRRDFEKTDLNEKHFRNAMADNMDRFTEGSILPDRTSFQPIPELN